VLRRLLGIDWMTFEGELFEAIPPRYTRHLGGQVLDALWDEVAV
jgi:hypothetical protein